MSLLAAVLAPLQAGADEPSAREPVGLPAPLCRDGIDAPSVPQREIDGATSEQSAAVSEMLLVDPQDVEILVDRRDVQLGTAAVQVRPVETAGTTFTRLSFDGELQLVGRSESVGLLSFDFVHESKCASAADVELEGSPQGGTLEILGAGNLPTVQLAEPWAIDANGTLLPTWFEFDGPVLRQLVDATEAIPPIIFDPTYSSIACSAHYSTGAAAAYLDIYEDDPAYCPVFGMLRAAVGYTPVWGFETNVANDYGRVIVKQSGECSYLIDTGPSYDFQVPCKAHDYCYDLRRAGFSGTVSDQDCDDWFFWIMEAHCNNRNFPLSLDCRITRDIAYAAVTFPGVVADPNPGVVEFRNLATGKCADVEGASLAGGAPLQQWSCVVVTNQRFRIWPAPGAPGYFHVIAEHSEKCMRAVSTGTNAVYQNQCFDSLLTERFSLQGAYNTDWYSVRDAYTSLANCWQVPLLNFTNGTNLLHPTCNDFSYWYLWRIVNV